MDELFDRIWALLYAGANAGKERSPFSLLQAATLGLDGGPKVRTVVLRRADRAGSSVVFHTDARSEKAAELARDPRIALVGCDLDAGIQIRLEGVARISADLAEREAVWNASRPRTLILYRAPLAPGKPIASPDDAHPSAQCGDAASMAGFENFCLIDVHVSSIDYLDLSAAGHVRARFTLERDKWRGSWLAP
jgi:pyridoxamine 5'-phosphate oxidase